MKRKYIIKDDYGSVNPVLLFIFIIGITSLLVLLLGHVLEPFVNLMGFTDSDINDGISDPRNMLYLSTRSFWPFGALIVVFLAISFGLLMEYQKSKYQRG